MYPHSFLWHYLWLAPHALQVVVVAAMIRRRLLHEFPLFLAYTLFEILQGGTLFLMDHSSAVSPERYWQADWVGIVVSIVLRSAVIYEIFTHVFRPYPAIGQLGRIVFRWTGAILLLVAVAVAADVPASNAARILSSINVVSRGVSLVQCGLLLSLFLFSSYFGLSWRSYVFGIAVGLGIYSSVQLAVAAIQVQTWPAPGSYVLDFVTMATYHCCVLVWLGYFLASEPARCTVKELPKSDLEKWNAELQRLLLQ
jgi:hypothetical protein